MSLDLERHSQRDPVDRDRIQQVVQHTLAAGVSTLELSSTHFKHTGDGYFCALLGLDSARVLDFLNITVPTLLSQLRAWEQAFRIGVDFGVLLLRLDAVTEALEHFDDPGIVAVRIQAAAAPNSVFCSERFHSIFHSRYPHAFSSSPVTLSTKDREIQTYAVHLHDVEHVINALTAALGGDESRPGRRAPREGLRILSVEDDKTVSSGLLDLFRSVGFEVSQAYSAEEALKFLDTRTVDLVVTDFRLPGMHGIDLVREVSARHPDETTIALTGFGDEQATSAFLDADGFVLVEKPVENSVLLRLVCLAGDRRAVDFIRLFDPSTDVGSLRRCLPELVEHAAYLETQVSPYALAMNMIRHKSRRVISSFIKNLMLRPDPGPRGVELLSRLRALRRFAAVATAAGGRSLNEYLLDYTREAQRLHRGVKVSTDLDDIEMGAEPSSLLALVTAELIDNALDSLNGTGRLGIRSFKSLTRGLFHIEVEDSGKGVDPSVLPHVFREGVSTKGTGRGMGLSVIRDVARHLGGDIEYSRTPRCHFTVTVPLAKVILDAKPRS